MERKKISLMNHNPIIFPHFDDFPKYFDMCSKVMLAEERVNEETLKFDRHYYYKIIKLIHRLALCVQHIVLVILEI